MDSERELALRVTLYLAYLRELSDIEQSDWRFLDAIPAEASQIERLLDRKWDANRDRAAHNFAELRRTAQLVSIDYFQESSAEDAPPILRHRRTWPRTSEPMSRLGDLAALVKRLFCADAGSLRTLLGHVPLPMVRRTTPGEEGGGGSGPSREEVRWLLTERFYAEPELIYQVATALDYYTGFVLAIANAAEKQREENASYPLLDKRRLVRWFQPAFWKGVRKRIQDRLGFAHAPVLQDDAEFQAFVDPVRTQTAPAGWLSRLKASLRSRPEMERPEQRMRRMAEALLKDRALRTRMANKLGLPVPFGVVLADEVEELNKRPHDRAPDRPSASPWTRAWGRQSIALCCSGGGIRSATFSLGVIQALADLQLLRKLDYLSTVSGGGYIGSWLVTWIKRAGSVTKVEEFLAPGRTTNPQSDDNRPIRRLREYSNYLAPKVGGLSADTWSIFTIWSRNTSINFAVILPVLIALMLTPRLWEIVQAQMTSGLTFLLNRSAGWFVMAPATFFLVLACISIGHNLASFDVSRRRGRTGMQGDNDSRVIQLVLMPSVMAAFFSGAAMWAAGGSAPYKEILGAAAFVLFVAMMLMQLQGTFWERFGSDPDAGGARGKAVAAIALSSALSGVAGALVLWVLLDIGKWLEQDPAAGPWHLVLWGTPLFLSMFAVVSTVNIALLGIRMPDERREWWSRLGAWASIVGVGWVVVNGIGLYGPWLVWKWSQTTNLSITAVWTVVTGLGAKLARSAETTADQKAAWWKNALIRVAPYVFLAGLLWLVSDLIWWVLSGAGTGQYLDITSEPYWNTITASSRWVLGGFLGSVLFALLLSWRADVNEFSMHHFYRNRLVRCYLGASRRREDRAANAFTGFDVNDDIRLQRLRFDDRPTAPGDPVPPSYDGPLLVINTALNITAGDDLAYQERKAESFFFTPKHCGYDFAAEHAGPSSRSRRQYGFQPSERFGDIINSGVSLGTAVAISGAAVNPNMGYHSAPAVSALLTLLNVRLGWWIGNPSDPNGFGSPSPDMGILYLLSELAGYSNERSKYVNLSDGGHFENLGIYEMVRRRCRYLIVCDGEQDEKTTFSGLANAVRKCRTDFGVEIEIDLEQVRRVLDEPWGKFHCAVGTITYPPDQTPGEPMLGKLVYLKASLTRDESADVLAYQSLAREFPHQSTLDQFFDESQFESYRKLGQHVAEKVFGKACEAAYPTTRAGRMEFFEYLEKVWSTPSPASDDVQQRIADDWVKLFDTLDPRTVSVGDDLLFPDLAFTSSRPDILTQHRFIAFMERVYTGLDLEHHGEHVLHRGWQKIFADWVGSGQLDPAWEAERKHYSQSFTAFWERLRKL